MPHGSDWSSIREAGMKADKLGAALATPRAEMDRGTHRKVMKLSLGCTSESRLTRWSQKALVSGPALFREAGIHPTCTRQS